ncbi:MAG: hypothetical protein KatS3mg105_2667 [Gemmatales bacterium]|nr:MAG: hypothetical protein KatS3mg105_2667 [Gemmatales bacterium]
MESEPAKPNDLQWLASLYVLGEMHADEQARFEELLAVDQTAREAVAEAVALFEAVRLARPQRRPPAASPKIGRASYRLVALAASLLLVIGVIWKAWSPKSTAPGPLNGSASTTQLEDEAAVAQAWAQLRQSQENPNDAGEEASADLAVEMSVENDIPAWMLAAFEEE